MRLLKFVIYFLGALVLAVGVAVGFLFTAPGKDLVARAIEKYSPELVDGRIEIGEIRGNFYRHLTLHDVAWLSENGRRLFHAENIVADLNVSSLFPPRVNVVKLQIEQPRGNFDISRLTGAASKDENDTDTNADAPQELPVTLQALRVVEGRLKLSRGKTSVLSAGLGGELHWPGDFYQIPVGEFVVKGKFRGRPLEVHVESSQADDQTLPLSAIRKDTLPREARVERRNAQASVILGSSRAELRGTGRIDLGNWRSSVGVVSLNKLHYEPKDVKWLWKNAPNQVADAKAYVDLRGGKARGGLEIHVEKTGKAIVEGELLGQKQADVLRLKRLRIDGHCPLLVLKQPAQLKFHEGDKVPFGKVELAGCGGSLSYLRTQKRGLAVDIGKVDPAVYLKAFSIPTKHESLGEIEISARLPRGPRNSFGTLDASWDLTRIFGLLHPVRLDANVKVRDGRTDAAVDFKLKEQHVEARATAYRLFASRDWDLTLQRARGKLDVSTTDFKLARLNDILPGKLPVVGRVTTNLEASGTIERSKVSFAMKAHDLGSESEAKSDEALLFDVDLSGSYDARQLQAQALVQHSESRGGAFPMEADLQLVVPQKRLLSQGMNALLRAPVEWQARADRFNVSRLFVRRQVGVARAAPLWATLRAKGSGTLNKPEAKLNAKFESEAGQVAALTGTFDSGLLDAKLMANRGNIDDIVPLFTTDAQTRGGVLSAQFNVQGPLDDLTYDGRIVAQAAELRIPEIGGRYKRLNLTLVGDRNLIRLEELKAHAGEGELTASGTIELEKGKEAEAVKLSGVLKNFELLATDEIRIESSGKLTLTADRREARFNGRFEVDEGKFTLPEKAANEDAEPLKPLEDVVLAEEDENEQERDIFERLHGSISVDVPGRFWIKSSELNVEIAADLEVGLKERTEFFITGAVKAQRGYAEFFGRHFNVKRALVEFTGEAENPRISADAIYKASPRDILVEVRGPLENMELQLSSDPIGYSNEEAMGVLLTGSPDYQRQGGGTSAGGAITGFLAGLAKKELGPRLPFDTLTADVATDREAADTTDPNSQTRIEVGKYLSDRLFIKLGRSFANANQQPVNRLTLDYRLSEKWSLQTTQTDEGRSNFDLQWTLNY